MDTGSEFNEVVLSTKCPFARKARIAFAPDWMPDQVYEDNIRAHGKALGAFVERVDSERLHGFLAKVSIENMAADFETVRKGFAHYLFALARTDDSCHESMSRDYLHRGWQFTYSGMRMFLNVFASCYPPAHSKFCDVSNGFYVFFQPERSFDFCGSRPLSEFKFEIRRRFSAAGMPYNGDLIDQRIEALIYMFPIDPDGEPVEWWRDV